MRGDFIERRYSDEELRRIFEYAAQSDASAEAVGRMGGHTLAEIRAIAEEVGIDPAAIDRAAANLVASQKAPASSEWLGLPRVLHEETVIPRSLSNDEMRLIASQAERVLGRRGALRDTGNWVEWRDVKDRLYVGIVRGERQTRVRAIADYSRELVSGATIIGILGISSLQTAAGLSPASAVAVAALIVGTTFGLIKLYWKWRSAVGRGHLQELLEILEDQVSGS